MRYYTSTNWNQLRALDIRIAQIYEQRDSIPDQYTNGYQTIERRLDGLLWRWPVDDFSQGMIDINAECHDALPESFQIVPSLLAPLTSTDMAVQDPAWYVDPGV